LRDTVLHNKEVDVYNHDVKKHNQAVKQSKFSHLHSVKLSKAKKPPMLVPFIIEVIPMNTVLINTKLG